jgi:hypothetical protein
VTVVPTTAVAVAVAVLVTVKGQQSGLSPTQPTTGASVTVGPSIVVNSGVAQYPWRRSPEPLHCGTALWVELEEVVWLAVTVLGAT